MSNTTPSASDIIKAIEDMSRHALDMLLDAQALVEKAANTEKFAKMTAERALGEQRAAAVIDLARISFADQLNEVVKSISENISVFCNSTLMEDADDADLSNGKCAELQVLEAHAELYGVKFPAQRMAEANEVVDQAQNAVAQNKKSNPYNNYRGKNAWCKTLYIAAFNAVLAAKGYGDLGWNTGVQQVKLTSEMPNEIVEVSSIDVGATTQPQRAHGLGAVPQVIATSDLGVGLNIKLAAQNANGRFRQRTRSR